MFRKRSVLNNSEESVVLLGNACKLENKENGEINCTYHYGGEATLEVAELCTICNYVIEHRHIKSEEWNYNETHHWHDCVENDGQEYDFEIHNYGDWVVIKEATETKEGLKTKTCECGNIVSEEIPMLNKTLSLGTVIGIIVGLIAGLGLIGFTVYWFVFKKKLI